MKATTNTQNKTHTTQQHNNTNTQTHKHTNTTHNTQHNTQHTTHNTQHHTHNTTHNTQHKTYRSKSSGTLSVNDVCARCASGLLQARRQTHARPARVPVSSIVLLL